MQLRAIIGIGLGVAISIGALIATQRGDFNPSWLSLPDALICLALIQGLRSEERYGLYLAGFSGVMTLALFDPNKGALFPGLLFLLISRYFQRTLEPNRIPLITQMARRIRGPNIGFSEDALCYTRRLTRAWSLLLLLLGFIQAGLVLITEGSWAWVMGNLLGPVLIFLFLIGEPFYRRFRLPNEPRHSLRQFLIRLLEADWKGMR